MKSKTSGLSRHLGLVGGNDHLVRAEALASATLPGEVVNNTT